MTKNKNTQIMYKGCLFDSRLEAKWAVFFDTCGVEWEYKPEEFDLGNGVKYQPSFLLINDVKGIDGGKLYIAVTNKVTFLRDEIIERFNEIGLHSDTKDKTAAEKLQGYWILEIGELAGLRKAEVETLRSFLSRQNDIYRAAFGRRATPHPRQCIFVGTTNAESGYLRDTTGNRRFWPVKTPGNGVKHSWELDENEIQQIWAEVLHMVNSGEKLYLTEAENSLAKDEQRAAMESDEREGLVREYLDTLLPTNWNDMDVYSRRNYMHEQDDPTRPVGSVKRTQVSNMEIWCECFGRERSTIRRSDSNELASILIKLGWVRQPDKVRVTLYGPQYVYVPKAAFLET